MKVLITGATGFVGQHFISAMHNDYQIDALVRSKNINIDNVNVHYYDGTISSIKDALKDIDVVLHLATYYRAIHEEKDVLPLLESNIVFGTQLLEAMKQTKTTRIVNVGTTWQKYEGKHYRYANLYAATKQAFQELLSFYADTYSWNSLNLHFNDTYGKNDHRKKIIQLLIETAKNGASIDMSPGEQRFETCHIDDAISALDIAIKRIYYSNQPKNEEFSILTGDDTSLKDLVSQIEKAINLPININWGAREYREREIMFTPVECYRILPGWTKKKPLSEGVLDLYFYDYLKDTKN
ncbi:TPA: NAD-dependent epimerase/dehydratase family protein [Vibrio cholerae]